MSWNLARIGLAALIVVSMATGPGSRGLAGPVLVNGSFSAPFITWHIDGQAEYVAHDWTPFVDDYDDPPGPPEFRRNSDEYRDPPTSQWVWSTNNSYRCGLRQTVGGFTPGQSYTFQVWILSIYGPAGGPQVPGDNIGKQLAVDLYGGTDWLAPGLFLGAEDFRDRRAYFSYVSFTAESPTATLFIHINNRYAAEHCQALWDDAQLYKSPVTTTDWSRVAPLPAVTTGDSFPVCWGLVPAQGAAADSPAPVVSRIPPPSPPVFYTYDVQYQVDGDPEWTTWHTNTRSISATFGAGSPVALEMGRAYAFRCRAHDAAGGTNEGRTWGWVESYPDTPDAQTTAGRGVAGRVRNNAADGVPGVCVALTGPAAVTATTGAYGEFLAGVPATGTYTLTFSAVSAITAGGYGPLPPLYNLAVVTDEAGTDEAGLEFLLPPADDAVQNGDLEGSDPLAGWHVGGDVPPTVTTSAHTGHAAALLGGGAGLSWLTQTLSLTDTLISPTLSFVYAFGVQCPSGGQRALDSVQCPFAHDVAVVRALDSATVPTDTFAVWAQGAGGQVVSVTQTATPTGWAYVTADLSGLTGTVTLYFWAYQASPAPAFAWVDEVHVGSRAGPLQRFYLPLAQRARIAGP